MEGEESAEIEEQTVDANPSNKPGDDTKASCQTIQETCTKLETHTEDYDRSNSTDSKEILLKETPDVTELCSKFESLRIWNEVSEQLENEDQNMQQDIVIEGNGGTANEVLSTSTTACAVPSELNTECTDPDMTAQLEDSKEIHSCDVSGSDSEVAVDQSLPDAVESSSLNTGSGDIVETGTDALLNSSSVQTAENDALVTSSSVKAVESESDVVGQCVGQDTQPNSYLDTSTDAIASESAEPNDHQVLETEANGVVVTQPKQLTGTLAPCYVPKAGEISLQACLARFCSIEMLDGTNRFRCDHCTQLAHEKEQQTSKMTCDQTVHAFDQTEAVDVERSESDEQIETMSPSRAETDHDCKSHVFSTSVCLC